jgi:hypothetical protein
LGPEGAVLTSSALCRVVETDVVEGRVMRRDTEDEVESFLGASTGHVESG